MMFLFSDRESNTCNLYVRQRQLDGQQFKQFSYTNLNSATKVPRDRERLETVTYNTQVDGYQPRARAVFCSDTMHQPCLLNISMAARSIWHLNQIITPCHAILPIPHSGICCIVNFRGLRVVFALHVQRSPVQYQFI